MLIDSLKTSFSKINRLQLEVKVPLGLSYKEQ